MQTRIEVRPVKGDEHRAAGAATARAYEEFAPQRRDGWLAYLDRIADVGGRAERATVLVAIVDGHVAGSVTLELDRRIREDPESPLAPDEAHVRMLGVDPAYRGRGIARALMNGSVEVVREHGKRRITLDTAPEMRAAQALYEGMGFRRTATRDMGDDFCLYSYELGLDSPAPQHP